MLSLEHSWDPVVPRKLPGSHSRWAGSLKWDRMWVWTEKWAGKQRPGLCNLGPSMLGEHRVGAGRDMDIYTLVSPFRSLPLGLWAPSPSLPSTAPCLEQVSSEMQLLSGTRIPLNNAMLAPKGTGLSQNS